MSDPYDPDKSDPDPNIRLIQPGFNPYDIKFGKLAFI